MITAPSSTLFIYEYSFANWVNSAIKRDCIKDGGAKYDRVCDRNMAVYATPQKYTKIVNVAWKYVKIGNTS